MPGPVRYVTYLSVRVSYSLTLRGATCRQGPGWASWWCWAHGLSKSKPGNIKTRVLLLHIDELKLDNNLAKAAILLISLLRCSSQKGQPEFGLHYICFQSSNIVPKTSQKDFATMTISLICFSGTLQKGQPKVVLDYLFTTLPPQNIAKSGFQPLKW